MNAARGSPGINKLANVLNERSKRTIDVTSCVSLEFGTIQADYSLSADSFQNPIPKGAYLICRQLTLGNISEVFAKTENDEPVLIPDKMRSLQPNDRVLIAWVNNDAVVVDLIFSS